MRSLTKLTVILAAKAVTILVLREVIRQGVAAGIKDARQ